MPEANLRIGIDSRPAEAGARRANAAFRTVQQGASQTRAPVAQVDRAFTDLTRSSRAIESSLLRVQRVLGVLGVSLGARELVRYADTWRLLEGRLRLVTDSTEQLASVQSSLFDIAQRSRTSFETTAELYARVARNADTLGKSQSDLLRFTEAVQKSVRVSGATMQEADNAVRQLTQGLASGALRGDEFRSVSEQLPAILLNIQKATGKTAGELRELAFAGELTADLIIDSMLKMSDSIEADFEKVPKTVGQAFTVLGNEVLKFVGNADSATKASANLAESIITLSENLDVVANAAGVLAIAYGSKLTVALVTNTAETVRNIVSKRAAAIAEVAATKATLEGAIAQVQMTRAMGTGTAARLAQAAATRQLAAAHGAHTAAVTAASTATNLFGRAIKFLGGPAGIAITLAASSAYLLLFNNAKRANEALEEQQKQLDRIRNTIEELTLAEAERAAAQTEIVLAQFRANRAMLEAREADLRTAAGAEGFAQYQEVRRQLESLNGAIDAYGKVLDTARGRVTKLTEAQNRLSNEGFAKALTELERDINGLERLVAAYERGPEAVGRVERALEREAEVLRITKDLTKEQAAALLPLINRYLDLEGALSFAERRSEMELEVRQLEELNRVRFASTEEIDRLRRAHELQRKELGILQQFGAGAYSDTLIEIARRESELRGQLEKTTKTIQDRIKEISELVKVNGRLLATGQQRFLGPGTLDIRPGPVRELTAFDPETFREKLVLVNRDYFRAREERIRSDEREAALREEVFLEAARGVQRVFAETFQDIFGGELDNFEDFADAIVRVFEDAASQIAAAFVAEKLGITKALADIEAGRTPKLPGAVRYGAGAAIGGLAGYQSGNVGTGIISGGISGLALGGPVAGILGAVGGLVGGLIGHAERAREAAERMREAQRAFNISLDRFLEDVEQAGGTDFERALTSLRRRFEDQVESLRRFFNEALDFDLKVLDYGRFQPGRQAGESAIDAIRRQQAELDAAIALYVRSFGEQGEAYLQLTRLSEAYREELERLEAELAAAQAAFREDIELRSLMARGLTEEAALHRHELDQQRELDDARKRGFDTATLAALEALHAEEDLAFARQRAAEAAQRESERLSFGADLAAREARLGGDDRGALAIELAERSRRELEAAQKLLDAGTITQEQFDRLALLLDGEVIRALEDFDKALRDAQQAAFDDLAVRKLVAQGLNKEAEELRLVLRHQKEIADAEQLKLGDEFLQELREVQRLELEALRKADEAFASGSASLDRVAEDEVVRSVTGISATQAQTITELHRTEIGILRSIDANIRKLAASSSVSSGRPNVDPEFNRRPNTNNGGDINITNHFTFTGGLGSGSTRAIEQGVAEGIDRALETRLSATLITTGEPKVLDPRLLGFA